MTKPLLYGLALLLCLHSFECGYIVLAPKSFRAGEDYKVSVGIEGMNSGVSLTGELKSIKPDSRTRITATGNVNNGDTTLLNFQVGGDVDDGMYNLTISGTDGGNSFINTTTVERVRNDVLVLIQTDKAIYKPNQVIKIRAFAINSNYNVVKRPITISIMDKNQNKLAEFKNQLTASGVVGVEFPLSDEPPFGDWSVQAETEGGSEMKTIKIDEYVLPKFEVNTELTPGYVLFGQQTQVTVKITAKYTYGKDVNGMAKIKLQTESMTSEKTVNFKGSVDVPFTVKEMLGDDVVNNLMFGSVSWSERKIDVTVNVTDVTTKFSILDDSSVKIYNYPQKIHLESMNSLNIYHPGLPIKLRVKVTDPAGEPLSQYGMTIKVSQGFDDKNVKYVTINSMQWYEVSFPTEESNNGPSNLFFKAVINGSKSNNKIAKQASVSLDSYNKAGNTVVQLTNLDGRTTEKLDLDQDQTIDVQVKATGSLSLMSYIVLSKGKIAGKGSLDFTSNLEQTIRLTVTSDMSPMANLLVYGVTTGKVKEIIVDVYDIMIDNGMKNKVSVQFSAAELRANSDVDLTVKSDPQSDVFVLGVDISVLLLATGNDITYESLMEDFRMFTGEKKEKDIGFGPIMNRKKRSISLRYNQPDANTILTATGLKYLTDVIVNKTRRYPFIFQRFNAGGGCPDCDIREAVQGKGVPDAGMGVGGSVEPLATVKHVRKYFPETWLWESGKTGLNGEVVFSSRVPDSITSWQATAFSVSPTNGLGLTTTPAKLKAFQKFFVSLNLPYSVRRGENFELLTSVSNYLKEDVNVVVTLKRSDDFAVLSTNSIDEEYINEDMVETVMVKSDSVRVVSFRVQPKKLGDITISVKAQPPKSSGEDGDAVDKTVFVKPEGFKMMNVTSFYVDLSEVQAYDDQVDIWYPENVVSGSRRAEVQVTGDVMGPALDGLENLLQVPYGCGEQNMISFVPNIFVCDYLTSAGKITEDIRSRSVKNMQTGYQRELKYRHPDGSFSAFGESDDSGSTWLTAFVLKSYSQASDYITIDSSIQSKSVQFLKGQLKKDGTFNEPGRVIHTEMLGGAGRDNKGLSAFVLTAMLESKDHIDPTLYVQATQGTISYLEGLVDKNGIAKTYEKAIILYALTLAKSPKANVLLGQLMDANFEKPWTKTNTVTTESPLGDIRITPYHPPKATASDVETWSYVLLSLCELDNIADARVIVKWLMTQQNSFGAFHSTQDTVVGLQSLAAYAKKTSDAEKDMAINVDANGSMKTFTLNKDNSLLLQSFVLSEDSRKVKIRATGSGTAIVKVMWRYYSKTAIPSLLPQTGQNKAPISLTSQTKRVSDTQSVVSACVKCAEDIGMSMISFDMPSGNTPGNVEELKKNKQIKRIEEKDEALHIYLDRIPEAESCFNVELMQTQDVKNIQAAPIVAKAYYQTEIETSVLYNIAEESKDFCDLCKGEGCLGCPTSMANKWNRASLTAVALICVLLSIIFAI